MTNKNRAALTYSPSSPMTIFFLIVLLPFFLPLSPFPFPPLPSFLHVLYLHPTTTVSWRNYFFKKEGKKKKEKERGGGANINLMRRKGTAIGGGSQREHHSRDSQGSDVGKGLLSGQQPATSVSDFPPPPKTNQT